MKVLKWVLIVTGTLFLVLVAVIVGWLATIETEKITVADLEAGGSYGAEERQALFDTCQNTTAYKGGDEAGCTCVAGNAGTKISRFQRLMLVADFELNLTKIFGLIKGLAFSGLPQDKAYEMDANFAKRIEALLKSCGLAVP